VIGIDVFPIAAVAAFGEPDAVAVFLAIILDLIPWRKGAVCGGIICDVSRRVLNATENQQCQNDSEYQDAPHEGLSAA
jgi:hypothetical protein